MFSGRIHRPGLWYGGMHCHVVLLSSPDSFNGSLIMYEFETRAGMYSLILILHHPDFNLLNRQTMSLARVLRVQYIQEYE